MAAIKLLEIDGLDDGTKRFQSQLSVMFNHTSADFIMQDGVMKVYRHGDNGFNFYETNESYEIVKSKEDMRYQEL